MEGHRPIIRLGNCQVWNVLLAVKQRRGLRRIGHAGVPAAGTMGRKFTGWKQSLTAEACADEIADINRRVQN